ncbi:hypothetical protein SDC9_102002 [bioreactor metagenome]|uniref:Uncharacterized protein n=1 Tax=bioreactor metagenome TaxID=1076179 RepID=A0A645AQ44_9ZZZZ
MTQRIVDILEIINIDNNHAVKGVFLRIFQTSLNHGFGGNLVVKLCQQIHF